MSANRIRTLFVLAMMAFALPLRAQTATITGRVTDAKGNGIVAARIEAKSGLRNVASAVTDESGNYRLTVPQPGTYSIVARRPA